MRLSFSIPGPPVPLERARRDPRNGHWYTPKESREYKEHVGWYGQQALALIKRGQGRWSKTRDARYGLAMWAYVRDERTRDWSNILKAVEDGLTGILWHDDSQIVDIGQGGIRIDPISPRVEVTAWIVEPQARETREHEEPTDHDARAVGE